MDSAVIKKNVDAIKSPVPFGFLSPPYQSKGPKPALPVVVSNAFRLFVPPRI